jgi:hypothetical protein
MQVRSGPPVAIPAKGPVTLTFSSWCLQSTHLILRRKSLDQYNTLSESRHTTLRILGSSTCIITLVDEARCSNLQERCRGAVRSYTS